MSYLSLEKKLGLKQALPVAENWSAAADFLSLISDYCLKNKPQTIVECSSGTSSLVLSQCCRLNQCGYVYSLENGEAFVEQTRQQLDAFLLSDYCDVIYAPLVETQLADLTFQWYELNKLPKLEIDLLVVDGPPGFLQKNSRYPAMPLLKNLLAEHCTVFLDDAGREDEKAIVQRWLAANPEFRYEFIDNERGCSILQR